MLSDVVLDYLVAGEALEGHQSEGLHAWASEVGRCDRQVGYRLLGIEKTDPMDPQDLMNFWIGNRVQELIQDAAVAKYGRQFRAEVPWHWPADVPYEDAEVHGRADGLLVDGGGNPCEVWEFKRVHRYVFELATGKRMAADGSEPGPKPEDVRQAALSAYALGAPVVRVIYVRTDANKGEDRMAEWRIDLEPQTTIADLEHMTTILGMAHDRILPARMFEGETIEKPASKRWPCGYCGWQQHCRELPSEAMSIDDAIVEQEAGVPELVTA